MKYEAFWNLLKQWKRQMFWLVGYLLRDDYARWLEGVRRKPPTPVFCFHVPSGRGRSTEVLLHGAKKRGSDLVCAGFTIERDGQDWGELIRLILIRCLVASVSTMPRSVITFRFPNIVIQGNSHHEASNVKSQNLHWLWVLINHFQPIRSPLSSQAALTIA